MVLVAQRMGERLRKGSIAGVYEPLHGEHLDGCSVQHGAYRLPSIGFNQQSLREAVHVCARAAHVRVPPTFACCPPQPPHAV